MMNYPENTIQYYEPRWWVNDGKRKIQAGRLIQAYLPHVHLVPWSLVPEDRGEDPTDHKKVRYSMKELKLTTRRDLQTLPAAAFPLHDQEIVLAYRGKRRPALVIYAGEDEIPPSLKKRLVKWQISPTALVIPYYGVEKTTKRAGFLKEFVERVKTAEYPSYYWDKLPISNKEKKGSICMLKHILPLGKHHNSIECTPFRLSKEALKVIYEWISWLFEGKMDPDGLLKLFREDLLEISNI